MLEDNFYLVHLKTLIDSSTKIQRLKKILASISKKSKDWIAKGERKEKMVLAIPCPTTLLDAPPFWTAKNPPPYTKLNNFTYIEFHQF
jgi:hypothetical protein